MRILAIACVAFMWVGAAARPAVQVSPGSRCVAPENQQFDFWVGEWAVFETNGSTAVAPGRVRPPTDGCTLREDYKDTNGLEGESLSSYDATTRSWQQTWLTNRGELLVIHGGLRDGEMVFSGTLHAPTGETSVRARWKPVGGGVRETAERSSDGGKTWRPWFDLIFRHPARHG